MPKLRIAFCGYREWALELFGTIRSNPHLDQPTLIKSKEEYDEWMSRHPPVLDFILFVGWSWLIPPQVLKDYLCLGIHPSDLPDFRGGSPIQNQIISGVKKTKISLMTLAEKIDEGDVWLKEDLSLEGANMRMIFNNIVQSSSRLLNRFFAIYPDIQPERQRHGGGCFRKRRKPADSRITMRQMETMELEELYDFIRCLTEPYPNAYLEDEHGNRLFFKEVRFEAALPK